ncbi:PREDICTED: fibronectin type 3 and ankyrin repeat domains protein 1-like [Acropora digitifera]|uniref:fibronectin type 3 and ankyrin repeat domains protein 1-like n=1 Tax=Acropora digitifera TaxID=70779 RepID=UPI00077A92FF|nr:PREDICTED: fibronectin type 3 and ankyrin repeat domains protein 1-like [Acropora digitifera]
MPYFMLQKPVPLKRPDDYVKDLFLNAAKNGDYERVQNFLVRTSRNLSVNVDAKDQNGFTAIMHAALNEHRKVVSLLLNYGADITLWNNRGQSVLDFAPDSMKQLLLRKRQDSLFSR